MIPTNIGAIGHRPCQRRQILPVIFNAAAVVNRAAGVGPIVVRAAALGNLDHGPVVISCDARDHVVQRLRPDFPAEIRFRSLLSTIHLHGKQPLLRVRGALHRAWSRGDGTVVKIDANEIQRRAHLLQVARLDAHGSFRQKRKCLGITPAQGRVEKPSIGDGVRAFSRQFVRFGISRRLARRHAERRAHAR